MLDFVEWIVRHPKCPIKIKTDVTRAFVVSRSAYRLADGDTIVALSNGMEAETFEAALVATQGDQFVGARTHLKNAAHELRGGVLLRVRAKVFMPSKH